jgi:hypothetical protein
MSDSKKPLADINETVKNLYRAISIKKGEMPDWEKFRSLFFPGAQLISNTGEKPLVWSVEEFIAYYRERIKDKTVEEFYEGEIAQKTEIFGKIAHRFSTYEAKPYKRGINSIQLLQTENKWLVTSLIWNDEQADLSIPKKYF